MSDYVGDGGGWSPTGIDWKGPHVGMVQFGKPDAAMVAFYKRSVFNEHKSVTSGMRVHDDVDYVRIQQPGEREQIVERPVQPGDSTRWPKQWQDYLAGRQQTPQGIPIDLLFPSHPSIADNLKSIGVHTVEQLSNLSVSGMDSLGMGAQDYVNYAKQYMDAAHKGVGFHQMQGELKMRDEKIRTLENTVNILKGQLEMAVQAMSGQRQVTTVPTAPVAQPATSFSSVLPPVPASFDAQTASINATHDSVEIGKRRRGRPPKAASQ